MTSPRSHRLAAAEPHHPSRTILSSEVFSWPHTTWPGTTHHPHLVAACRALAAGTAWGMCLGAPSLHANPICRSSLLILCFISRPLQEPFTYEAP